MKVSKAITWVKAQIAKPSIRAGATGLVSVAAGAAVDAMTHNASVATGAGMVAAAMTGFLLPGRASVVGAATVMVEDIVRAEMDRQFAKHAPKLVADAVSLAMAIAVPPAAVAAAVATQVAVPAAVAAVSAIEQKKI